MVTLSYRLVLGVAVGVAILILLNFSSSGVLLLPDEPTPRYNNMPQPEAAVGTVRMRDAGVQGKTMAFSRAMPEMAGFAAPASASDNFADGSGDASLDNRRMVKLQASLTLQVPNIQEQRQNIVSAVQKLGGYVASSNSWSVSQLILEVRIPADKLDGFLVTARTGALRVVSESTSGVDVTDEYVDTAARVRNADATHAQLLDLMKRAATVSEALEVQMALDRITERKEMHAARKQRLEKDVSLATVHITLEQEMAPPQTNIGSLFQPGRVFRMAAETLLRTAISLVHVAIWLLVMLVPATVLCAVGFVCFRYVGSPRQRV